MLYIRDAVERVICETKIDDIVQSSDVSYETRDNPMSPNRETLAIFDNSPLLIIIQTPSELIIKTNPNFDEKLYQSRYYKAYENKDMLMEVWGRCLGKFLPDDIHNITIHKPRGLPDEIKELFFSNSFTPHYSGSGDLTPIFEIRYSEVVVAYVINRTVVPSNYIKTLNEE